MLTADFLQVLDVILVRSHQQQVTLVCQLLHAAAVDELDHVRHGGEVQILIDMLNCSGDLVTREHYRDDDLVVLVFPHVVLEHRPEHGGPGTQHCLVALDGPPLTLDGHVSQSPRVQQLLHVIDEILAPVLLPPDGVPLILIAVTDTAS